MKNVTVAADDETAEARFVDSSGWLYVPAGPRACSQFRHSRPRAELALGSNGGIHAVVVDGTGYRDALRTGARGDDSALRAANGVGFGFQRALE